MWEKAVAATGSDDGLKLSECLGQWIDDQWVAIGGQKA